MTRSLALFALLSIPACTLLNPQFDPDRDDVGDNATESAEAETAEAETAESEAEAETDDMGEQPDTGEAEDSDDMAESSETGEDPIPDLPDQACEIDVGHRIDLGFSNPASLMLNACNDDVMIEGVVVQQDDGYHIQNCGFACDSECGVMHPIVIDFDLAPLIGTCVTVEAAKPIVAQGEVCLWSALSVLPSQASESPYFIAVNNVEPTPLAASVLQGWPMLHTTNGEPTTEQKCTCLDAAAIEDCCMGDDEIVTYSLIFNDGQSIAYVGDVGDFEVPSSIYDYSIYNAMARTYGQCANGAIELSWKIYATNGF